MLRMDVSEHTLHLPEQRRPVEGEPLVTYNEPTEEWLDRAARWSLRLKAAKAQRHGNAGVVDSDLLEEVERG